MDETQTKILLIEDNPGDARLIQEMLFENRHSFKLNCEDNLAMGLRQLVRKNFDVVLLDLSLPDSHGLATFTKVHDLVNNVPIIVLTGLDDETTAVKALHHGAQDYLLKDTTNANVLVRAIRYARERHGLVTVLSQKAIELEARNMALDEFAHTLAHQVQGLLAQLIGYASYAEMYHVDELSEEMRLVLSKVLKSGNKMNNILNELLLLASIRQSEVELVPIDMRRVIQEVRKRLANQIEQYQGQITLPPVWPQALGHVTWIEEVWVNYIGNGLKYGGPAPHLTLGAAKQTNGMIKFWIRDKGQGLTALEQKKLFKPHSRLRHTKVKGEGLGLSIVRRIVEMCGGKVGVESKEGQGSIFWFTLPNYKEPTS